MSRGLRIGVFSVAVVLISWEVLVQFGVLNPIIASSPTRIVAAAFVLLADPEFFNNIRVSALEFVIGFTAASVLGASLGLVAGWYRRVGYAIDPLITILYVTPRVALLPVLVLWLGLGPSATTAVVFLGAFFMVLLNTMAGVKTLDPQLIRAARSFMASDRTIFRTIVLPGTFPFLITGLRLGVGRALIGVVIGELFAAAAGLGYFIHITAATLQIDRMFVAVFLISLAGLSANGLLSLAERRVEHWRPAVREI
jgi:NitT/TauT family transport system permease protein